MGEMADMMIEQGIAQMTDLDFDLYEGVYGDGGPIKRRRGQSTCCKYCGKTGLKWHQVEGVWRLIHSKSCIHSCKQYRDAKRRDPGDYENDPGPDPAQLNE